MKFSGPLRKVLVAVLFLAVPLFFYLQKSSPLPWYDQLIWRLFSPVVGGVQWVERATTRFVHRYFFLLTTERENEVLRQRLGEAALQKSFCESVIRDNERWSELLGFQKKLPFATIAAGVLTYPPLGEFRQLTVNRGAADGVERGAAVLVPQGLVGRVIRVEDKVSQILLLTDPTSVVDARVVRTGARGLVVGQGIELELDRKLFIGALEFWDRLAEVSLGDLLVTSGLDGVFPPDIPIGNVRELQTEEDAVFLKGKVIPAVDFNQLSELLILKNS